MKILNEIPILNVVSKENITDTLASGVRKKLYFPDAEMPVSIKISVAGKLADDDAVIGLVFKDDAGMILDRKTIPVTKVKNDNTSEILTYFLNSTNYITDVVANITSFHNTIGDPANMMVDLQILEQSFEEQSANMLNSIPMFVAIKDSTLSGAAGDVLSISAQLQKITKTDLGGMNEVTLYAIDSNDTAYVFDLVEVTSGILAGSIVENGTLCVISDSNGLIEVNITNSIPGEYRFLMVNANGKAFMMPTLTWT